MCARTQAIVCTGACDCVGMYVMFMNVHVHAWYTVNMHVCKYMYKCALCVYLNDYAHALVSCTLSCTYKGVYMTVCICSHSYMCIRILCEFEYICLSDYNYIRYHLAGVCVAVSVLGCTDSLRVIHYALHLRCGHMTLCMCVVLNRTKHACI